jgi:hypothetical protein
LPFGIDCGALVNGGGAKEARFRVDGMEFAVLVRSDPRDVIADDGGFPTQMFSGLHRAAISSTHGCKASNVFFGIHSCGSKAV